MLLLDLPFFVIFEAEMSIGAFLFTNIMLLIKFSHRWVGVYIFLVMWAYALGIYECSYSLQRLVLAGACLPFYQGSGVAPVIAIYCSMVI